MSIDAFGNSPSMTQQEMIEAGLVTLEDELTDLGKVRIAMYEQEDVSHIEVQTWYYNRPHILTVGLLKAALDGIPDDYHVTVATDGWFDNIVSVDRPNLDAEDHAFCVNLFPSMVEGGNYDSRQH